MKKIFFFVILVCLGKTMSAQYVYTIKADSVKITNTCDTNELIIENHTQNVPGFLFNTGNGRTIFKQAVVKLNDSMYLIGSDTLKVLSVRGWSLSGNAGTVDRVNFIGTTDATPLNFRIKNVNTGRVDSATFTVALGFRALDTATTAKYTTAIGYQAARYQWNTDAGTTAIGALALTHNKGHFNTAVGFSALTNNGTGGNNVAVGLSALTSNNSGSNNIAIGVSSMLQSRSGSQNVAIGTSALYVDSGGTSNIAIGASALYDVLGGRGNISIGASAAKLLTAGVKNIFIGDSTAYVTSSTFSGNYNTIIGANILMPKNINNTIILADGQGNRRLNVDSSGNFMVNTTTPLAANTFSGTGNFSDTLTATTMGSTDSSNRVATTAWVKQRGYIGTAFNGILNSSLTVNGAINARGLRLNRQGWADYVFDSTYRLLPLKDVEGFIKAYSHLPGIPSAAEVTRHGVDVGETQVALLKKIEELTLYTIQQDKKIDELNKKVEMLIQKIQSIEKKQ